MEHEKKEMLNGISPAEERDMGLAKREDKEESEGNMEHKETGIRGDYDVKHGRSIS